MPGRQRSKSFYVPRERKEIDPIDRTIGIIEEEGGEDEEEINNGKKEKEVDEEEGSKPVGEATESIYAGNEDVVVAVGGVCNGTESAAVVGDEAMGATVNHALVGVSSTS